MKTIKTVNIIPVFVETAIPEKEHMVQDTIYISKEYKTISHLCLCGCGNEVVTPIHKAGWNLTMDITGRISLTPSIGNYNLECKSHYIITNNKANFV
jgi:hypothetical protein